MLRFQSGNIVKAGLYWNRASWEIVTIPPEGGTLPGPADARESYLRVPMPLMLVIAPLMGLLYVIFLPFVGFVILLGFAARKLMAGTRKAAAGLAAILSEDWGPGEAYLAGRRPGRRRRGQVLNSHKSHESRPDS